MIIGLDLDNTIIDYYAIFLSLGRQEGLVLPTEMPPRDEIRARVRNSAGGDELWQEFQAIAYGDGIAQAQFFEDFLPFIEEMGSRGHSFRIISHKTERSNIRPEVNLREAALGWLHSKGLFNPPSFLRTSDVFFAETREEKIRIIKSQQCECFVDDLIEVLEHQEFPETIQRVLFAPHEAPTKYNKSISIAKSWIEILELLKNGN